MALGSRRLSGCREPHADPGEASARAGGGGGGHLSKACYARGIRPKASHTTHGLVNLILTSAWTPRPQTVRQAPNARPSTSLASVLLRMNDGALASGHLVQASSGWRQVRRRAVSEKRTAGRQAHPPRARRAPGTAGGPEAPPLPTSISQPKSRQGPDTLNSGQRAVMLFLSLQ